MGVPAELLWRQLPPTAFSTDRFVLTAQLEPWHEIGGDAFDYSLDADTLHLAVFDGMGHGLAAALLASVALAAYRNARRGDLSLAETAVVIDQVLAGQFGTESFVTGVFGRLDLVTGSLSLLCAAHPAPLLIRDGRPVGEANTEPGTPLGFGSRDDVVLETSLQPGDRLLMFSDGVVEARSASGEFFGLDRLLDLVTRQESNGQPPPETLRRLIVAVLEHQDNMLQDDATVLLLEWAGDPRALPADAGRLTSSPHQPPDPQCALTAAHCPRTRHRTHPACRARHRASAGRRRWARRSCPDGTARAGANGTASAPSGRVAVPEKRGRRCVEEPLAAQKTVHLLSLLTQWPADLYCSRTSALMRPRGEMETPLASAQARTALGSTSPDERCL
jgi:hypothetical protein